MGNFKNNIGDKVGYWTILGLDEEKTEAKHRTYWICKCDCENGTIQSVRQDNLKTSSCNKCGRNKLVDLTGKTFHYWKVMYQAPSRNGHTYWHCKCDCALETERDVDAYKLKRGISTSCGCDFSSKGEKIIEYILNKNNISYEKEKIFPTCKLSQKGIARFDFYVDNKYLIEFDGEQHFILRESGWNDPEKLKRTQERDVLKNQWCRDNNIPLIRIPYTHLEDLCIEDLLLETSKFIVKE